MKVKQFRYARDNLGYLVYSERFAMAIDGGAAGPMLAFASGCELTLRFVTNTHSHADHTVGNRCLLAETGAVYLDRNALLTTGKVEMEGETVEVINTPGHSRDSVSFYTGEVLIAGDTLFNGTVGNCFSGDMEAFLHSLKKLLALPVDTVVYAGHDYVKESMAVAKSIEPDNPHIDEFLCRYDHGLVRSTLAEELRVNPYIRFNDEEIITVLVQRGLPVATEFQRWKSIMSLG